MPTSQASAWSYGEEAQRPPDKEGLTWEEDPVSHVGDGRSVCRALQ